MSVDLLYTDIEEALRSSVADLLADRSGPTAGAATIESDQPCDLALWETLGGLGVTALLIPEKFGGVGGSTREAAVVAEELGRAVAPVPFLGSAVLATTALVACAAADPLHIGDRRSHCALAVPLATMPVTRSRTPSGSRRMALSKATSARWPTRPWPDSLVVPAIGPGGPALYSVSDFTATPVTALDRTRGIADVTLNSPGTLLAGPASAPAILDEALTTGQVCWRPTARCGAVVSGHDRALRQGALPVRSAGRLVPGVEAPVGGRVAGTGQPRGPAR